MSCQLIIRPKNAEKTPVSEYLKNKCSIKLSSFLKGIRERKHLRQWLEKPEVPEKTFERERCASDTCFTTLLLEFQVAEAANIRPEHHFPLKAVRQFIGPIQSQKTPVVVVLGGINPTNRHDLYAAGDMFLRYDPIEKSLLKYSMMPVPRHHHQAVYLDGNIYVIGGFDPRLSFKGKLVATATCFKYAIKSFEWTRLADMKMPRAYHGAVVLKNQIYVIGGKNHEGRLLKSVEKYDEYHDKWISVKPGLCCPRMAMGCTAFKGKIWLAGGLVHPPHTEKEVCVVRIVETYDPDKNVWRILPTRLPFNMFFQKLCAIDSCLLLMGGATIKKDNKFHFTSTSQVFRYDDVAEQWLIEGHLKTSRHDPAVTSLANTIFIVGGCSTSSTSVVNDIETFNAVEKISTKIEDLPLSVTGSAVVTLPAASAIK